MSKSPSLRRIQADIRELSIDPSDQYHAAPLESDMFVWHFTIRGAPDTDFEGGIYHGKILLSSEYPFKPPDIMFLTPNGRFETNTKLCLSFSAYHPELWQPAWGIRLILEALISFLPTKGDGAIGALDWTSEERKRLAKKSWEYNSPVYGNCKEFMDKWSQRVKENSGDGSGKDKKKSRFQKEIEQLHALQAATEGPDKKNKEEESAKVEESSENVEGKISDKCSGNGEMEEKKIQAEEKVESCDDEKEAPAEDSTGIITDKDTVISDADIKTNQGDSNIDDEPVLVDDDKSNFIDEKKEEEKNESNTEELEETAPSTTENTAVPENQNREEAMPESPLLSDPVVHTGIIIFSVIVYLLIRKLKGVVSDLRELDALFRAS